MSDDMGYSDIAPYGGEIDTPNLSNLAKKGLKFTQFYNNARCSATRASPVNRHLSSPGGNWPSHKPS